MDDHILDGSKPVHQHRDGSWWFWDETGVDENGPYPTQLICEQELARYCREYLGPTETGD